MTEQYIAPNEASGREGESAEDRIKRLRMRSWRRGTKEMDLILGPFADQKLSEMSGGELAHYDRLLTENDQDLYAWITGARQMPELYAELLAIIGDFAGDRLRERPL